MMPAILLAAAATFVTPGLAWPAGLTGGIGAFVLVSLVALLSRGGLGGGDVTLSTFLGFILGVPNIILSLTFGVFLGGFTALFLLVTGRVNMKTFIPYGPFLTITGWIMLIWGAEIWKYYFY
jgi:leader peptidase (prepilin peptidase)/N-methyltransferase